MPESTTNGTVAVAGACDYAPFGAVIASAGVSVPWQFSSEYADAETGLNLYAMCANDPVNAWDVAGLLIQTYKNECIYVDIIGFSRGAVTAVLFLDWLHSNRSVNLFINPKGRWFNFTYKEVKYENNGRIAK